VLPQTQVLFLHVMAAWLGQIVSQPPQLFTSTFVSMQTPVQSANPWLAQLRTHAPLTQSLFPVHLLPQVPQLLRSVCGSKQDCPQRMSVEAQPQAPAIQRFGVQSAPQLPQSDVELCRFTQRGPHASGFSGGQTHWLLEQI
jgi:hypothetical protein